ncbi:Hypothetical predicted protein [Mytilus galloprovincialis]|uniref:Uncharacterized protein n=1 Tax=Mytilus galloprovincialis TaxID=29158 RepID=A0A8B6CLW6_MYTGA|nr:Hypothetical predicted protein [Mytilus galloprovincialis]
MATENQVVIEQQGFLPDTSDEISPSELSKRKKVVDFFCRHKLVFIAVICGIIVGVLIGLRVCNLTHQQEAEDNGNTTICNRTNEEGSSNALSNQINQQNAQDKIIDETPSPNTSYSSLEKCYYETPEDFLMKMLNNTFANEDYCTIGSQLVKTICWTGKEKSGSSHACTKCTDGSILPSICFCDEKVNCVNDAKLFGSRAADHSKKTCSWCKTIFNKQFKDQGNANCSSHNQPLVDITFYLKGMQHVKVRRMYHEINTIWKLLPLQTFHGFQYRRNKRQESLLPGCCPITEERYKIKLRNASS